MYLKIGGRNLTGNMSGYISTFNPLRMEEQEILALATGIEHRAKQILGEMERCLKPITNHHFLLYAPRGFGKSFFTKYLKINFQRLEQFKNCLFIQFPEEQSNIQFVSDIIEMLCAAIEGRPFQNVQAKWEIDEFAWKNATKKLKQLIKEQKVKKPDFHLFFTMENLQDFIPRLDEIESGRLREFLEQFKDISLIGTSIRPNIASNYDERLFQVFKDYEIKPWEMEDCLSYYDKRAKYLKKENIEIDDIDFRLNRKRVKAISEFTGGSPRIAVILTRLVLEENIESVVEILQGIIDELTPYYQDLTKAMPLKSKILFDTLIRNGENMTQSNLAELLGKQQNVISKPFKWLKANYYIKAVKQQQGNRYHHSVRDRLFVLYWQQREMLSEGESIIAFLASCLFQLFGEKDFIKKTKEALEKKLSIGIELLRFISGDYEIEDGNEKRNEHLIKIEEDRLEEIDEHKLTIYKLKNEVKEQPTYEKYNQLGSAILNVARLIKANDETIDEYLKEAILYYKKSLEKRENEYALNNIAYLKLFTENIDEAIYYFKKCVDINPKNIINIFRLGATSFSKDRFSEAIKFYDAGLSIQPKNYGALIDVAHLHFILHQDRKGFDYLDKASKLDESIKIAYKNKTSRENMFYHSAGKILDFSRERTRHELFSVMMAIIEFFKKEEVGNWSYAYALQTFLQRLYIYGKVDLMLDVISEVKSSIEEETRMDSFLSALEAVFSIPDVLNKIDIEHESFKKLPSDIRLFLQGLEYANERFESGNKMHG